MSTTPTPAPEPLDSKFLDDVADALRHLEPFWSQTPPSWRNRGTFWCAHAVKRLEAAAAAARKAKRTS